MKNWYKNHSRQALHSTATAPHARGILPSVKATRKRHPWQAYSALYHYPGSELTQAVDDVYKAYVDSLTPDVLDAMKQRDEKVKTRLFFLERVCKERLQEALEDVQQEVNEKLNGLVWNVPEYLRDAATELSKDEMDRFMANHGRQL